MARALRALLLAALLALAAASSGPPDEYDYAVDEVAPEPDDFVVVLGDSTFDTQIATRQWALVRAVPGHAAAGIGRGSLGNLRPHRVFVYA